MKTEFTQELHLIFFNEAQELVSEAEPYFHSLESMPVIPNESYDYILRFSSNLVGSSQALGFKSLSQLAFELEKLVTALKCGKIKLTPKISSLLIKCKDRIRRDLTLLKNKESEIPTTKPEAKVELPVSRLIEMIHHYSDQFSFAKSKGSSPEIKELTQKNERFIQDSLSAIESLLEESDRRALPQILNGLEVEIQGTRFIIPSNQILEVKHADSELGTMKIVDLNSIICLNNDSGEGKWIIVSVFQGETIGYKVDRVFEIQKWLKKPIQNEMAIFSGASGVTLLNDGTPALFLDLKSIALQHMPK